MARCEFGHFRSAQMRAASSSIALKAAWPLCFKDSRTICKICGGRSCAISGTPKEIQTARVVRILHRARRRWANSCQLSWDEIHGILERAVERGLARRQAEEIPQLEWTKRLSAKGIST